MALTPAEKQKAYRARKKAEAEVAQTKGKDIAVSLYRKPFSQWAENDANIGECDMYMALAGMEFPGFDDERDAQEYVIDLEAFGDIDIFGADHIDAYPDVLAALNQLGYDYKNIKVLISMLSRR